MRTFFVPRPFWRKKGGLWHCLHPFVGLFVRLSVRSKLCRLHNSATARLIHSKSSSLSSHYFDHCWLNAFKKFLKKISIRIWWPEQSRCFRVNSLWFNDAIQRQESWSSLVQIMAWRLMAPAITWTNVNLVAMMARPAVALTLTHCGLVTPYGSIELGQHWIK